MKNQLLLAVLLVFSSHLLGQDTTIIEKWYNGSPKKNLILKGSDTLYFEYGYANGQTAVKRWGRDSVYCYGYSGNILKKFYRSVKLSNGRYLGDSTISFDAQGRRESIQVMTGENSYETEYFDANAFVFKKYSSEEYYENRTTDNKLWSKGRFNRKNLQNEDTLFYPNGKIRAIVHGYDYSQRTPSFWRFFDKKGNVEYASEDQDILSLEKDNTECLYGFRNSKGDWAIPPQYENVKPLGMQYFIASNANDAVVMNQKGEKIENTACDFLDVLKTDAFCRSAPSYGQTNYHFTFPDNFYQNTLLKLDFENATLLKFRKKGLYGVMDVKGNILLPPQYQNVRKHSVGIFEVQIGKKWGMVDASGKVLVRPEHYEVNFTKNPHIFITSDTFTHPIFNYPYTWQGLANDSSRILLPNQFHNISIVEDATFTFKDDNNYTYLFDCERGYIIDTSYWVNDVNEPKVFIVSPDKHVKSGKNKRLYGVVNPKGEMVLPMEYLDIQLFYYLQDSIRNLLQVKTKEGKYGIYNVAQRQWFQPPVLDNIGYVPYYLGNRGMNDEPLNIYEFYRPRHLVVQKEGKCRILKPDLSPLWQEEFDYFGYENDVHSTEGHSFLFLVKDNKVRFYSAQSFPLADDFRQNYDFSAHKIFTLKTIDGKELLFNQNGELLVPPQYKLKNLVKGYAIVEEMATKKQKILSADGTIKDFLPQYNVLKAYIDKNLIIVEDPKTKRVGVVNTAGETVIPVENFGVVAPEKDSAIWVRKDFPDIPKDSFLYYNEFQFTALDTLWRLHDVSGKLLTTTIFKKPFHFYQSVGIGIFKDKMGLWNKNGELILPPQYKYILRDTIDNIYYLAREWADSSVTYGFADATGCVVKEANFTNMSRFFGDYAYAALNGQQGIIDKQGNWLCPLTPYSISNFKGNLIDSFLVKEFKKSPSIAFSSINKRTQVIFDNRRGLKLTSQYNFRLQRYVDSLTFEQQRVAMNCILATLMPSFILPQTSYYHERVNDSLSISPLFLNSIFHGTQEMRNRMSLLKKHIYDNLTIYSNDMYSLSHINLLDIKVSDEYVNLVLYSNKNSQYSQNYHLKNGVWSQLYMQDVLNLSESNVSQIRGLLASKIKDLRNEDLDCGNGLSFFEAGSKLCFFTEKGIVFQYERKKNPAGDFEFDFEWRLVQVPLTWQELQPFIKK